MEMRHEPIVAVLKLEDPEVLDVREFLPKSF